MSRASSPDRRGSRLGSFPVPCGIRVVLEGEEAELLQKLELFLLLLPETDDGPHEIEILCLAWRRQALGLDGLAILDELRHSLLEHLEARGFEQCSSVRGSRRDSTGRSGSPRTPSTSAGFTPSTATSQRSCSGRSGSRPFQSNSASSHASRSFSMKRTPCRTCFPRDCGSRPLRGMRTSSGSCELRRCLGSATAP